jgi:4-amino-4-deoxy-L-arabinose transferase-like glycosyltransferase
MDSNSRSQTLRDVAWLLVASLVVLWLGLGTTRLWDQDEGYYASVAREMFARHDWVVPTFNQELFAHKPPMMFWGMLVGFQLFGVDEFAARWASAFFGTGMILLTYFLGKLLIDRRTGLIAALVLVSSLMFTVVARSATADVHLGFFILLAITLWVRDAKKKLSSEQQSPEGFPVTRLRTWIAIYLSISLAVLSKGPIGFAFPIAILGSLTLAWPWISGQKTSSIQWFSPKRFIEATLSMRPFAGAVVLMLVAAPWFLVVNLRTEGAFFREFFGVQHIERFSKPMDNHSGPIYYYLLAVLIGFFPWTSFAIPIALHTWKQTRQRSARLAWSVITVWLFFYFVVFSLASTKLPNYIIPAYPAVALAIASYFSGWFEIRAKDAAQMGSLWRQAGWMFMILSGLFVSSMTLTLATRFGQPWLDKLQIDAKLIPCLVSFSWLGVLLLAAGILGLTLQRFHRNEPGLYVMIGLGVAWVSLLWQLIIPGIDRFQTPQKIALELIAPSGVEPVNRAPAVVGMFRPSMVFYSKQALDFCQDDRDLEKVLSEKSPKMVVVNQSSKEAQQLLDEHGYRLAQSLDSFPKRGSISVYRK